MTKKRAPLPDFHRPTIAAIARFVRNVAAEKTDLLTVIEAIKTETIKLMLQEKHNNKAAAAKALGINRTTMLMHLTKEEQNGKRNGIEEYNRIYASTQNRPADSDNPHV